MNDDDRHAAHVRRFTELLLTLVGRVEWPAERIRAERRRGLRELLRVAVNASPWHRERLRGVDPNDVQEADLERLPVMTKSDLMEHFDDIVTDRRVTLERCEQHLDGAVERPYLLDEYSVTASGGSSGRRGVFVFGRDAWATAYAQVVRFQEREWRSDPTLGDVRRVTAVVGASKPTHISAALSRTFSTADAPRRLFPVDQPLHEMVAGLNALQPTVLMGYPSYLPHLVGEARAGRLRIQPRRVIGISEPMLPEIRSELEDTWRVPVLNAYGMSEGAWTGQCGHSMHLPDDLCVFEPVDSTGAPVARGEASQRVLLTNLYNHVLPLVRYELDDELTLLDDEPCPCGCAFDRIADPLGRLDDMFLYEGAISVHPHVFRSPLGSQREVVEYQVIQTASGADIRVVARADFDERALAQRIRKALSRLGVAHPDVAITRVPGIERQASGKLKRFVASRY